MEDFLGKPGNALNLFDNVSLCLYGNLNCYKTNDVLVFGDVMLIFSVVVEKFTEKDRNEHSWEAEADC